MVDELTNYDKGLDELILIKLWYHNVEQSACVYVNARAQVCICSVVCMRACLCTYL